MPALKRLLEKIRASDLYRSSPPVQQARKIAAGLRQGAKDRLRPLVEPPRREIDHQHIAMLISWLLDEDSVAVDVGAHSGEILDLFLQSAPRGRHVAVEPLPQFHEHLRATYPGVTIHPVAVGAEEGTLELTEVLDAPALSGLGSARLAAGHATRRHTVAVKRLDDLIPSSVDPALIKIDVEGAEYAVLQGAFETLRRCHPVLVFEHQKTSAQRTGADSFGVGPLQMHGLLAGKLGYRIFDIDGGGPLSADDMQAVFDGEKIRNFVAH